MAGPPRPPGPPRPSRAPRTTTLMGRIIDLVSVRRRPGVRSRILYSRYHRVTRGLSSHPITPMHVALLLMVMFPLTSIL